MAVASPAPPPAAVPSVAHPPTRLPVDWTMADLQNHLGGIPPSRIRIYPPPGMATESDVLRCCETRNRLCELVDGVLVEKAVGFYESLLAAVLIRLIGTFAEDNDLGIVLSSDGALRIIPQQVRVPDVAFLSWNRFPDRKLPREKVPDLCPDLAVEVLSEGNTPEEMQRKLAEYFAGGSRLVWYIDPAQRTAEVYTAVNQQRHIPADGVLDGGDVLPGFQVSLAELFRRAGEQAPADSGTSN